MNTKALIGSTQTLFYKFFSEATNELADLDNAVIIVYDSSREIIVESTPIRTDVGEYYYKLIIPNNPPHIYVECSGTVEGVKQCTRDIIECIWAETDINPLPATDIIVGANSYISLEEADLYMQERFKPSGWFELGYTVRMKALKEATKSIDTLMFKGKKSDNDQLLSFPRNITHGQIPEAVKKATCEEAISLIDEAKSPESSKRIELQKQGVTEVKFGDSHEKYDGTGKANTVFNTYALQLLRPYLLSYVQIRR